MIERTIASYILRVVVLCVGLAASPVVAASPESWTAWGGPRGDFTVTSGPLAERWPETGPPRLWERPLGGGYSSVLHHEGTLFTLYRDGDEDVLIALDAGTGETRWENRDRYSFWSGMERSFGIGPNSTPLLIEGRVVGIGVSGRLRAVSAETGEVAWRLDLPGEFGRLSRVEEYGYSANPLPYEGSILTPVGGEKAAIVALNPKDGSIVWKSDPGGVSYGQPTLTRLAGRDHYLYFEPEGLVALDPTNGRTLWKHPIEFNNGNHLTPAVRCSENHVWVSSQFDTGGGRLLKIEAQGERLTVEEVWFTPKLRASHWTLHCRGDFIYGSIGGNGTSRIAAVEWKTGEVVWQEGGYHKALALWADEKLLFLSEDGELTLARVTPDRFEHLASAPIARANAWTLPTLAGTTLYIRDEEKILALDLSPQATNSGTAPTEP